MVRILTLLGRVVERLGTMVSKQSSVNLGTIHKKVTDILGKISMKSLMTSLNTVTSYQLSGQVQGVPL